MLRRIADREHDGDVRVEGIQPLDLKIGRDVECEPALCKIEDVTRGASHQNVMGVGCGSLKEPDL